MASSQLLRFFPAVHPDYNSIYDNFNIVLVILFELDFLFRLLGIARRQFYS